MATKKKSTPVKKQKSKQNTRKKQQNNQSGDILLDQESPLAFLGSYSAKIENDPEFGKKFYSILFAVLSVITLLVSFLVDSEARILVYGIAGMFFVLAILAYFAYAPLKRYDIASTKRYCETLYPGGSAKVIKQCIVDRQREERLRRSTSENSNGFGFSFI